MATPSILVVMKKNIHAIGELMIPAHAPATVKVRILVAVGLLPGLL